MATFWILIKRLFNILTMSIFIFINEAVASPWTNSETKQSPFPIQFGIPECKVIVTPNEKELDFAPLIPGDTRTYIYTTENKYYKDYQRSYYAVTRKKAGWDCMRHYEILANGCIPYFINLDECDLNTMFFLPRELIYEAMNLPGVSYLKIDHEKFDKIRYFQILEELLDYTRNYLTSEAIANYLLKTVDYMGHGKILYLSGNVAPDYMRCSLLIGLKTLFGDRIIDYPKIEHIYETYTKDCFKLYGRGMSYTCIVPDPPINRHRTFIQKQILNEEFDLIIYGSVHRGLPFLDFVKDIYPPEKIIYICGEDFHHCQYKDLPILFLREFKDGAKKLKECEQSY